MKAKGGGKGKVAALCCARHYCAHCLGPESAGYGKAMMRCVRCVTSYHRACLPTTPLTMVRARAKVRARVRVRAGVRATARARVRVRAKG